MRILYAIGGAFAGAMLASGGRELFAIIIGLAAGLGLFELRRMMSRVDELERQLARAQRPRDAAAPPAHRPESVPAAAPAPAPEPAQAMPAAAAAATSKWAPPRRPAEPPPELPIVRLIREYFTGGNTLVRVGVVVLFFGVAFLLRYVAEHSNIPMEFRLAGVALGAIALLVLGWRLRHKRPGYALAIQGGAVAILYLTVFVALRLYLLLPAPLAFLLLVLITAFATALAVVQNSMAFAMLSLAGGFLAPVLTSTGQGNHVVLFSFYAVLNAGILGIAWFKAWRPLLLVGFAFTFVIGTVWGVLRYSNALFASTEPFLILFFVFYVAMAVLFALRQAPDLKGYVDGTIVFGTPVAAFALQSAMLHDQRYWLAISALAVGGGYIALAALLWQRHRESLRLLVESFVALGVAFGTLAVPLALDGHWTAATWALEGTALVWIGCRQDRSLPRAVGVLLQFAAGLIFWRDLRVPPDSLPILNSAYLGGAMVSVAAIFSTLSLERARDRLRAYENGVSILLFAWGVIWWLVAGLSEIDRRVTADLQPAVSVAFCAVTAWLLHWLRHRWVLEMARWPALALPLAIFLAAAAMIAQSGHPFASGGVIAWPFSFAVLYVLLRANADEPNVDAADGPLSRLLHSVSAWLLLGILTAESVWQVDQWVAGGSSWYAVIWALLPLAALWALPAAITRIAWPLQRHAITYSAIAGGGVALYLALWLLAANLLARGDTAPLPYLPLLNPLDLASGLVVFGLAQYSMWLRRSGSSLIADSDYRHVTAAIAGLGFVWLNGALLRAIHHLAGVPFSLEELVRSTLVQVSLSIFWTLIALGAMLLATRRASRPVWLVGAGLLAVVIAKLFLVDLSRIGSVERIVSFVVVGLLILVIGYFSPLPPDRQSKAAT